MKVWINGDFYDRDEAKASVFDAGFQHGVGCSRPCKLRKIMFRLDDRCELHDSARELGLTARLQEPLAEAVQRTVEENGFPKTRVRVTLTGGDLNLLTKDGVSQVDPTILIVAQPSTPYPEDFFLNGVTVVVSDGRLNPLDPTSGHKTLTTGRIFVPCNWLWLVEPASRCGSLSPITWLAEVFPTFSWSVTVCC